MTVFLCCLVPIIIIIIIIKYVLSGLSFSLFECIQNTISLKVETDYCAFDCEVICKHVCRHHEGDN